MNIHAFNTELAARIGLEEALVLTYINFWVEKNELNNKNFYEGQYWTYNTYDAFIEQFPYMKMGTLRRVLKSLADDGHIVVKQGLGENPYDRTNWFGIPKTSICRNLQMGMHKTADVDVQKSADVHTVNKHIQTKASKYDEFISALKVKCPIKSKVTSTKEGKKLFDSSKFNVDELIESYYKHQVEKGEYAKRITAYMLDYESFHNAPVKKPAMGGWS